MLKKNEYVVFSSTGVCEVVDIVTENFDGDSVREYYVLNPVRGNSSTIYIPTDNQSVNIRKIMTKQESQALLEKVPEIGNAWIEEDSVRRVAFADAIQSGTPEKLVELIKILYARQDELTELGKKLSNSDTETLKNAEQLLFDELAYSLSIPSELVPAMVFGATQS